MLKENGLTVAFIGLPAAGKTTLIGQCLLASGSVSSLEQRRLRDEAHERGAESTPSLILDSSHNEWAAGRTLDIGRTLLKLPDRSIMLVDCPSCGGCSSAISGVGQADVAALVVASPMNLEEQTVLLRDLISIARLAGDSIMVVLNCGKETEQEKEEVTLLSQMTAEGGFQPRDTYLLALNAFDGRGVAIPSSSFGDGRTLFQTLLSFPNLNASCSLSLRAIVLTPSEKEQKNTVLLYVERGTMESACQLCLYPAQSPGCIDSIFSINEEPLKSAPAGSVIEAKFEFDAKPGWVLCKSPAEVSIAQEFEVHAEMLCDDPAVLISSGSAVILHFNGAEQDAIVTSVTSDSGISILRLKEKGILRLRAHSAICIEKFDASPRLGRLLLRYHRKVVALVKVIRMRARKSPADA